MAETNRGGRRVGAGRKPKPKIEQRATKGIASEALASIDERGYWRMLLRADQPLEEIPKLELAERRLIEETLEYLTNRRDGKPAQGVFVGDTRDAAQALDRGDLPSLIASPQPSGAGKPN